MVCAPVNHFTVNLESIPYFPPKNNGKFSNFLWDKESLSVGNDCLSSEVNRGRAMSVNSMRSPSICDT